MKIAYLAESAIPSREANSVQVMKMCQAFAAQGHDVTLYARRGSDDVEDLHRYYGVTKNFAIVRCRVPRIGRVGKAWYGYLAARAVKARALPDLFYARETFALAATAMLGRPMILEAHGLATGPVVTGLQRWLFRRIHFRRLVVISRALREDYRRVFPWLPAKLIVVAHDAADLPANGTHEPGDARRVPRAARPQVGYIGHLYPGKGMEVMVPLARRLPDVDFHVVGGTPQDLESWQCHVKDVKNLRLHGHVAPERTEAFRQRMDVLLMPSQRVVGLAGGRPARALWISPLKLFEYMASRKPIVASDLPVLREVLSDGANALLVPPADVEAWAGAIERLTQDDVLRRRLADQAFADVSTRFTWTQRAQDVLAGVPS